MLQDQIESEGFFLGKSLLAATVVHSLLEGLREFNDSVHARKQGDQPYAFRNILNAIPEVRALAISQTLLAPVSAILGPQARPVKATLFDKTAEANWNLRWHQDNVIAVAERKEAHGFHGWTEKTGIPHVRPPAEILAQMLAARVHLDDCPAENGALMVIPGTHLQGRLSDEEQATIIAKGQPTTCAASIGDVLFLRPLLLHCSRRAEQPVHRRILHIEYAAVNLPFGLEWGE